MMKEIHYAVAPFYYGIFGTLIASVFIFEQAAEHYNQPWRLSYSDFILFSLIGITGALGALFKSLAFHYEKVATLSFLKYTNLFYSMAADLILFNSQIYGGEIVGAILILGSNSIVALLKYFKII